MNEEWIDIPSFEGKYQATKNCKVRSLNYRRTGKIKELTLSKTKDGYQHLKLRKDNKDISYGIHEIMYMTFIDRSHDPKTSKMIVEHIKPISEGGTNDINNLQLLTQRDNVLKSRKAKSKYAGVSYYKASNKWRSFIHIGKKRLYLGTFDTEIEAHQEYIKHYKKIMNN